MANADGAIAEGRSAIRHGVRMHVMRDKNLVAACK